MNMRRNRKIVNAIVTVFAFIAAAMFIMPTVLTIANSFMTSTEISANYGAMLDNMRDM